MWRLAGTFCYQAASSLTSLCLPLDTREYHRRAMRCVTSALSLSVITEYVTVTDGVMSAATERQLYCTVRRSL